MECKFKIEGKKVVLQGLSNGAPRVVFAKRMERDFCKGQVDWVTQCLITNGTSTTNE